MRSARTALLIAVIAAASCSSDEPRTVAITDASIDDRATSTISAVLSVDTDEASVVSVTVDGPGGAFEIPADASATSHTIPVVGMRAESTYSITAHAAPAGGGEVVDRELMWKTGALPDDLPPIIVTKADASRMQDGVTVFNAMPWAPTPEGVPAADAGFVIAVDEEGEVVWYARIPQQVLDIDTTRRGTFVVNAGDVAIQEIDLLGAVVRDWGGRIATGEPGVDVAGHPLSTEDTEAIEIDSAHHEVTELDNGNVLTLSTELIELTPEQASALCPDNPEQSVVGDVVVELSPEGEVVQEWPLSAIFDPTETPGAEMCIVGAPVAPPNWFYPASKGTRDWTHANAIALDDEHNTLVVSSRHLDRIIGIRYHADDDGKAGEQLWSLGVDGTIEIDGEPTYHQHAMELEDDGSILVYDNGNFRPGTKVGGGNAPPFSRAVLYDVDLDAGTAKQTWEHRDTWPDGRPIYTPFLGDVDREPNGNVLITHGGGASATGSLIGRILEVVPGTAPDGSADETVFDITVGDGTSTGGWTLYRAERLESLYFAKR